MIKTITVGDLHGLTTWKSIVPEDYDKIIFIGDYVDSFYHSDKEIENNLLDVIEFKKTYPKKIVLLLGNHDIQYLFSYNKYGCSGFRLHMYTVLHSIFNEERELFLPIYVMKNEDFTYIWSHAGLHENWYWDRFYPYVKQNKLEDLKLEEQIESAFLQEAYVLFQVGHLRGGFESVGGIFWADRTLTAEKPLEGYHQIVGHSKVKDIIQNDKDFYTSIIFIDCLEEKEDKFYKLDIY